MAKYKEATSEKHRSVSISQPGLCFIYQYGSCPVIITSTGWQSPLSRGCVMGQRELILLILRETQTSSLEDTTMYSELFQTTGRDFQSHKFTQVLFSHSNSPVPSHCSAWHGIQGSRPALAMWTPWCRAGGPAGAWLLLEDSEALTLYTLPLAPGFGTVLCIPTNTDVNALKHIAWMTWNLRWKEITGKERSRTVTDVLEKENHIMPDI